MSSSVFCSSKKVSSRRFFPIQSPLHHYNLFVSCSRVFFSYIFVRIVRILFFSKQEKTFIATFPNGKIVHMTKIMWPEFFRHSGKLFSPRAKSAKEEVKQRQGGNKKEEKQIFFQGFPEAHI